MNVPAKLILSVTLAPQSPVLATQSLESPAVPIAGAQARTTVTGAQYRIHRSSIARIATWARTGRRRSNCTKATR
jgi:hypothetical protein